MQKDAFPSMTVQRLCERIINNTGTHAITASTVHSHAHTVKSHSRWSHWKKNKNKQQQQTKQQK
jgi:hypothetical protein